MNWINRITNTTAQEGCRAMPGAFSDLILTSVPFDSTFAYGGHWYPGVVAEVAPELFRIARPGSVLCWMVRDQIRGGRMTGESHRQVLTLMDAGWWLSEEITFESGYLVRTLGKYYRTNTPVYVFTKGWRSSGANNLIADVPLASKDRGTGYRFKSGEIRRAGATAPTATHRIRGSTWYYPAGGRHTCQESYLKGFPAKMHESLAEDLILSYSQPGDVVFDPFAGVCTTPKMALLNGRRYCAFEPDRATYQDGVRRMKDAYRSLGIKLSGA